MSAELTYAEVQSHSSKKDLYVVIHDKIYNASTFVDEHPYVFSELEPRASGNPAQNPAPTAPPIPTLTSY
jgi:hypothetical protein